MHLNFQKCFAQTYVNALKSGDCFSTMNNVLRWGVLADWSKKISKGANYVWRRTQTYVKAATTFSYRGGHHIFIDHLSYARQVLKNLKDNKAEVFPLACRRVVYSKERWQMLKQAETEWRDSADSNLCSRKILSETQTSKNSFSTHLQELYKKL